MKRHSALFVFLIAATSLACMTVQKIAAPTRPVILTTPGEPVECSDETCLDACLIRLNRVIESDPVVDVGGDYAGKDANFNLVTYTVDGDTITNPVTLYVPAEYKPYQEDTAAQQRAWDFFVSIVPAENRKWVTQYMVFTDGSYNTLAWISHIRFGDNARWQLGVDVLDSASPVMLTSTLVHELGHLLTLNSDQVPSDPDEGYTFYQNEAVCPQFMLNEGCSTPDSYINKFYQLYWVDIHEDWLETVYKPNANSPEEFRGFVRAFHDRYPGEFLNQYAATNIKEDMAVSFATFVLNSKPGGDSIAEKKVVFFYDFPELVSLRRQIIQNLCAYVQ